jgi:hydrogenase maturation protein HypF
VDGPAPTAIARRGIRVRGLVQGVGFRPFVYRLAHEAHLSGWVCNDAAGVSIEVQGPAERIERFVERLASEAPALARVDTVETHDALPLPQAEGFRIESSRGGVVATGVVPDAAVCADCLEELFDPADRRWRYPFINCTHCGPRYTITSKLPYDRPNTSMARFAQCPDCLREYRAPEHRRFHAQPNACPVCGPSLSLLGPNGRPVGSGDCVAGVLDLLAAGAIVAMKSLGGFHLACDARSASAVAALRQRKVREAKPFALMLANAASCKPFAAVPPEARAALESVQRPIVLLDKRTGFDESMPGVAPGMPELGVMLPYTPLHYLLFHEAAGRPAGTAWLREAQALALVMTSANPGGEPLVIGNEEALARLRGIADAFLMHDREIVARCDDSLVRPPRTASPRFVRRARGYTPAAIRLPAEGPPVLAVGALLKNAVCLTRGSDAFLSQHIGDLDNAAACGALDEVVAHLEQVLEVRPAAVVHDLHPDFYSTRAAAAIASARGIPLLGVQHHHAHVAAVAAEHRVDAPVLGLALDGLGLGTDGGLWGGELLVVGPRGFERAGRLRELPLPGGDRAAREPWRCAAALLHLAGQAERIERRFADEAAAPHVRRMLAGGFNSPPTSSMGRWFDAAAGLLGVARRNAFEGQAAMLLEGLARRHGTVAPLDGGWSLSATSELDPTPLLAWLADEPDAAHGAALFHATLAEGLAQWAIAEAGRRGLADVAFGGGCFLNRVLSDALRARLERAGLRVLEATQAPPNDGGLALGQAWAAMQGLLSKPMEV